MLAVEHLSVSFVTRLGVQRAVDDVSFTVAAGEITAIIGESGSGKSVACYSLLGLVPQPPGRIDGGRALFHGPGPAATGCEGAAPNSRPRHRDGVPGPDDLPEPLHDRSASS